MGIYAFTHIVYICDSRLFHFCYFLLSTGVYLFVGRHVTTDAFCFLFAFSPVSNTVLAQMELSQAELVGVLNSTNEGLEATQSSATENVAIVDGNIRALDQRLAGVGWS